MGNLSIESLAVIVPVVAATIGWAFAVYRKISSIDASLKVQANTSGFHKEMLDCHESRLDEHDKRLSAHDVRFASIEGHECSPTSRKPA